MARKVLEIVRNLHRKIFSVKVEKRSDYLVYTNLVVFFFGTTVLTVVSAISRYTDPENFQGGSLLLSIFAVIFFFYIIDTFRRGHRKLANLVVPAVLFFSSLDIMWVQGPENSYGLLLAVMYILVVSIIFYGWALFSFILLFLASYITIFYLELRGIITPDLSWQAKGMNYSDMIGIFIILLFIVYNAWRFNQEIGTSLTELGRSQSLLQKEKELLESRVAERTKELQREQAEKFSEISRLTEFGRLARGLFHDFASPLTALSLNLGQLKKEKLGKEMKRYLLEANTAAENMRRLIDSTAEYSKGKITSHTFSVSECLNDTYLMYNYKAKIAGVSLVFPDGDSVAIFGNRVRFSRLIGNLVINSLEAYEQRRDAIRPNVKKEIVIKLQPNKTSLKIIIEDNALGIPEEVLDRVFEPFQSTKDQTKHIGIGLSMCKDIVESDFRGTISVKSRPGSGTSFIITIPQDVAL